MNKIVVDGTQLSIEQIYSFISNTQTQIEVSTNAYYVVEEAHRFLESIMSKNLIYGINTGFGPMANHLLGQNLLLELQENLIKSHAVGMGKPLKTEYVLAMMLVRLNTLIKGCSGVSGELINTFTNILNHRIVPKVPEHGSVGASGDLVQLAHIALILLGEGQAFYQDSLKFTIDIMQQLSLSPYHLKPKEGLALINGTAAMSGIAAVITYEAEQALQLAVRLGAFAFELVNSNDEYINAFLHQVRPHHGQQVIAKTLCSILLSSKLLKPLTQHNNIIPLEDKIEALPLAIQGVYSIRCIPQILGPVLETLEKCRQTITIEINSATDNPIVNVAEQSVLHGGNFHGDYIALTVDELKIALIKLTMLTERRINFFLHHKLNMRLPPFLNLAKPGLTLGLQGLQFVATSTAAHSQSLGYPHYLHSISTNADNQDIVSMGTDAALFAAKVVDNLYTMLVIEMVTLTQATDCLGVANQLSDSSQQIYQQVRSILPTIIADRVIDQELNNLLRTIRNRYHEAEQFYSVNEKIQTAKYAETC